MLKDGSLENEVRQKSALESSILRKKIIETF